MGSIRATHGKLEEIFTHQNHMNIFYTRLYGIINEAMDVNRSSPHYNASPSSNESSRYAKRVHHFFDLRKNVLRKNYSNRKSSESKDRFNIN